MPSVNLIERGASADEILQFLLGELSSSPNLTILMGVNDGTLTAKPIRIDGQGKLLISGSTTQFDIVNTVLADTVGEVVTGGAIFRKVTFYAKNANALLSFRLTNGRETDEISVVPNLPLTIEGVFAAALARNESAGVVSTLQVIVNYDLLQGQ